MEIFLIRHTTPEVEKGICYGQTDLELASTFQAELTTLKAKLQVNFDQIYSSPLKRCTQLAGEFGGFQTDNRLKELNFGDWEMKAWNDIPNEEINPWMNDFVKVPPPGGESFQQLIERTTSFLEEILLTDHKQVAIVAHAGVIRAALGFFMGLASENLFRINIDYGGISQVKSKRGYHEVGYLNR